MIEEDYCKSRPLLPSFTQRNKTICADSRFSEFPGERGHSHTNFAEGQPGGATGELIMTVDGRYPKQPPGMVLKPYK